MSIDNNYYKIVQFDEFLSLLYHRFERRLHVPLPDASTRTTLIKMFLKNTETDITGKGRLGQIT